ncbi:MAG TPA: hypothetical protein VF388_09165, partial [Lacunisphaera sp.]
QLLDGWAPRGPVSAARASAGRKARLDRLVTALSLAYMEDIFRGKRRREETTRIQGALLIARPIARWVPN